MLQNYFIYNGKRYNSGDVIYLLWYGIYAKNPRRTKANFIDCDPEKDEYRFSINNEIWRYNKKNFYRMIIDDSEKQSSINGRNNPSSKTVAFKDELNIDGMLIAWIWYIFIMAILVIFKDRIIGWIFVSIIFFNYRNKKLREAGYKK